MILFDFFLEKWFTINITEFEINITKLRREVVYTDFTLIIWN